VKQDYEGKQVRFNIIQKDSKGNDHKTQHLGNILFPNGTKTGYVIQGDTIFGCYNRNKTDIEILDLEPRYTVHVTDCTRETMVVA